MSTLIQLASAAANTGDANRLIFNVKYDEAISKGDAVYVSGADGTNILVKKADYTTEATSSKTLGLALVSGPLNFQGQVIAYGLLSGIDTSAASGPGDAVWLGAAGGKIYGLLNKPYAPLHLVSLGVVTKDNPSTGEIFVKTQNGFELDEIHDVQLKGAGNVPLDGEVLTYEAATNLWKAKPIVTEEESPLAFVMAATDGPLTNTPVYYNGPANDGIGATLTSVGNVVLSDNSAVGRIDTNYIPEVGDLILVKNQTDQRQNGIYEITQVGSTVVPLAPYILTRSIEADEPFELYPLQINVFQGLVNGSKYFTQSNTLWGDAVPPVIGGIAPAANIIFDLTSLTTTPLQITFVDNVTSVALPACTYTPGLDVTKPGVGATLIANSPGALTVSGMAAASSTINLTTFNTLLVRNQTELRHNGTYQVVNPGNGTTRWVLRRIDNLAAGFNKALRIVFCSHNVSAFAGSYFTPTWNPTLLNKNIGITTAVPVNTNKIEYVGYTPQNGRFGIANANGAYTYYISLASAMSAALSGQTIEMFADYTETACVPVQLKNGVNINLNGHTYTQANNVCVVNAIQDGGVAVNCSISNGTIVRTLGQGAALGVTGASVIRGDKLNLIGTVLGVYGSLVINNVNAAVYNMFCRSAGSATTVSAGSLYDTISIGLNGVGLSNTGLISNCTGIGTGAQSILNNAGGRAIKCIGYNGTVSIQNLGIAIDCTAISNIGGAFTAQPNSTSINCTAYSTASFAFGCNGNSLIQNCKGISTAGVGISMINGKIEGCMAYSATSNAISTSNSGATPSEIINCHAVSIAAATIAAGNTVPGSTIYKTYIECLWSITFGHAITVSSAGANLEVIQCFIRTIDSTANAIFSSVLKTVKYSQNAYKGMTVPINSFVVQGITNTQDNQGNILI